MAEAAVGLASLAIALPGVIDLTIKYGEWISTKITTFRNARAVWAELATFGHRLSQGNLKDIMVIAKEFYNDHAADPSLKASLELDIRRLSGDVEAAWILLNKLHTESNWGRATFSLTGERRVKELNKTLKAHESELVIRLQILGMRRSEVPPPLLLSESIFAVREGSEYKIDSTISVARGEYTGKAVGESLLQNFTVIIERADISGTVTEVALKNIAYHLHRQLTDPITSELGYRPGNGILPCLGYRMQPMPQLIFKLPEDSETPKTLRGLLIADRGVANHPLDFRLRLARRLANAVLRVHMVQLVHKNIRAETILLLKRNISGADEDLQYATDFGEVYLTNWRLLRKEDEVSQRKGSEQWKENLYRHPERQGLEIEERYNLGHDIYSLGVCLLEIGLWDSLVQSAGGAQPRLSDLFTNAAARENLLSPENNFDATKVKKTLLRLARERLPPCMGLGYKNLVVACLTGLDQPSGFGQDVDIRNWKLQDQGFGFVSLVLSHFKDMSL